MNRSKSVFDWAGTLLEQRTPNNKSERSFFDKCIFDLQQNRLRTGFLQTCSGDMQDSWRVESEYRTFETSAALAVAGPKTAVIEWSQSGDALEYAAQVTLIGEATFGRGRGKRLTG